MNRNLAIAQLAYELALADGLLVTLKVWDQLLRKTVYIEEFSDSLDITAISSLCKIYEADIWNITYYEHECVIFLISNDRPAYKSDHAESERQC